MLDKEERKALLAKLTPEQAATALLIDAVGRPAFVLEQPHMMHDDFLADAHDAKDRKYANIANQMSNLEVENAELRAEAGKWHYPLVGQTFIMPTDALAEPYNSKEAAALLPKGSLFMVNSYCTLESGGRKTLALCAEIFHDGVKEVVVLPVEFFTQDTK